MTTKLYKKYNEINATYRDCLKEAVKEKFGIEIKTEFSFFAMSLYSSKEDGTDFTQEQKDFMSAFEAGYLSAMNQVRD